MRSVAFIFVLATTALAHLQMQDPYPIKSPLNQANPNDDKDYDYTAPLIGNGLPYPCKGYLSANPSLRTSQKSWAAGSTQSMTIAPPGAVHGGGSCQLSLSYDQGATWNVIWSYIGGCMAEDLTQQFKIPQAAPGGEAVFAWSWFNRLGNREMYHNCAVVTITGGGSGLNSRDHPAPFVANAGSVNSCGTTENIDPVFPNPGATVKYSGEYKGTTPAGGRGITGSNCAHPGGADGAGTRGSAGAAAAPPPASTTSSSSAAVSASHIQPVLVVASSSSTTTTTTAAASTSSAPASVVASSSTTTTAPSSPASTSTGAPRKCRRRRSESTKRFVLPPPPVHAVAVDIQAHRNRSLRRHHARAWSHADLARRQGGSGSGRVAAMKAERPVYAD